MSKYGNYVIIEMPLEEVYFLNVDKLSSKSKKSGKDSVSADYLQYVKQSMRSQTSDIVTIPESIALSVGGYNDLMDCLIYPPCKIEGYVIMEVESEDI